MIKDPVLKDAIALREELKKSSSTALEMRATKVIDLLLKKLGVIDLPFLKEI